MKKSNVFLLIVLTLFIALLSAPLDACTGSDCINDSADGYINAGQNQWQNNNQYRYDDSNFVSSTFSQSQYDWAHGEGTNGFTGDIALGQGQGMKFDETRNLGQGAFSRHWGEGVQSDFKEAAITERCKILDATGGQNFNSNTYTDQNNSDHNSFMSGGMNVNTGAHIDLRGDRFGTSAALGQSQVTGYEHVDRAGNWQNGFVATNTDLNIPKRNRPEPN